MILKYEFKDYLPKGIIYFALMSIVTNMQFDDWGKSLVLAFFASMGYVIALFWLGERRANKAKDVARYLMKYKRIICQGFLIYKKKGAWVFLSEETLDIYFDTIDVAGPKMTIILKDIVKIESDGKNQVTIHVKGGTYQFVVVRASDWMKILHAQFE